MESVTTEVLPQAPARDIGVITAEIQEIKHQAQVMALYVVIELGRRLVEAKEALPHGEWGNWLRNEAGIKQSSANNDMRLFQEYGAPQLTLFGAAVNSQSFANLPYSKALALLAIPQEEREDFAEEVHADDLSVKELKKAIEERDKAQKLAAEQEKAKKELIAKLAAADKAAEEARKLAASAEELQQRCFDLQAQALHEKTAAKELQKQLDEAKANPTIPKETLDRLRKEAAAAANKEAEEKTQKALEEARRKAEKATETAIKAKNAEAQARANLEEAQKKLKTASPEVAAFKALFDSVQASVQKLRAMIEGIRSTDAETADKLAKALKAFGASL